VVVLFRVGISFDAAMPLYPGDAPYSNAVCRKVAGSENDCGKGTTARLTETITRTPSFRKRSRRVLTCARAQLVPPAARRCSFDSTQAATLSGTRNWLAKNRLPLARTISMASTRDQSVATLACLP